MPKKKTKAEEIEIPSFKRILAEFNKRYGKNTVEAVDKIGFNVQRIPTGIKVLDDAIGGGLPKGRIVDFYGIPSSGKSLVSLKTIVQAQAMNLECIYFDCEHGLDPDFVRKIGVDTSKLAITRTSIGEDVMDMICKLLPSNPGMIVLDSVATMVTKAELEEASDHKFMAPKARLMSSAINKIIELNKDTLLIFINQLRSSMNPYGLSTYSTGGRALEHAASMKIEISRGEKLTADGKKTSDAIGQMIKFRVEKSKVSIPKKYGSFKFFYEDGKIE